MLTRSDLLGGVFRAALIPAAANGDLREQVESLGRLAETSVGVVRNITLLLRPSMLDDLGLREAAKKAFKLKERPTAAQLREIGDQYKPWRTIATWYLWRSLG